MSYAQFRRVDCSFTMAGPSVKLASYTKTGLLWLFCTLSGDFTMSSTLQSPDRATTTTEKKPLFPPGTDIEALLRAQRSSILMIMWKCMNCAHTRGRTWPKEMRFVTGSQSKRSLAHLWASALLSLCGLVSDGTISLLMGRGNSIPLGRATAQRGPARSTTPHGSPGPRKARWSERTPPTMSRSNTRLGALGGTTETTISPSHL